MTLMKSILLGSAAGIVAVAGAQAADLPTKKAAPAEYVRICNVGGMAGFVIPGSDTCLKIGGYVTAQVEAGNNRRAIAFATRSARQRWISSSPALISATSFGYITRTNVSLDARQNTAYGVLRGYWLKCSSTTATASTPTGIRRLHQLGLRSVGGHHGW